MFFGDGAADEGGLYESVNFAMLKKLPVIYIYENNHVLRVFAHLGATGRRSYFPQGARRFMATGIGDGNNVLAVYAAPRRPSKGRGTAKVHPSYECRTYRVRGHAGAGSDEKLGLSIGGRNPGMGSEVPGPAAAGTVAGGRCYRP